MADGQSVKALKKIVETETLAANALAVAIGKVKDGDLRNLLAELQSRHEDNASVAGSRMSDLGGKYPIPGLREDLKKGWDKIAQAKTAADAVNILQRKERDSLINYREQIQKLRDDRTVGLMLRSMADSTEHLVKLNDKLLDLQKKERKGGGFLGIPWLIWLLAAAGGGGYAYWRQQQQAEPKPETAS